MAQRSSHHHIVSAGYLRLFAERSSGGKYFVQQIDKESGHHVARLSVRDALAVSHHNSAVIDGVRDDALEREWQSIEGQVLPFIQRMAAGELHPASEPRAVVQLMAIHLARAAGTEAVYRRVMDESIRNTPGELAQDPKLLAMASAEEIIDASQDGLRRLDRHRAFRVERMGDHHNWFLDYFADYSVERITAARPKIVGFVTSDNPVVLTDDRNLRVGVQNIAVMDAQQVFMPLSPTVLVALSKRPKPDATASPIGVQRLNGLIRRAAVRFVVAHPAENIKRAAF